MILALLVLSGKDKYEANDFIMVYSAPGVEIYQHRDIKTTDSVVSRIYIQTLINQNHEEKIISTR